MDSKDLLVIGGGPAGIVAALRAAEMGQDVTLAEKGDLGGVCLNRGCIPSKALVTAGDLVYYPENSEEMGINADVKVNYKKVTEWSNGIVCRLISGIEKMLKNAGVEIVKSEASFTSSEKAQINGESVEFQNAIIATGSSPQELPNIKFDHEKVISSDDFFALNELPGKMLILGAGYIGMELGTVCAKLGSEVIIIEMMDQILPNFDKRIVRPIARKAKKIGLDIRLGLRVTGAEADGKVTIWAEDKESREESFTGDKCLVSVGRAPTTEALNLDATDVTSDENGFIKTDDNFQTEDSAIHAIGDVVGGKMLAHEAYRDAVVAVDDILGRSSKSSNIPEVIFTDPQLAKVGEFKKGYSTGRASFRAVGAAYTKNKVEGVVQISVDEEGILRGGRIVGPYASEIIHEIGLAVENELSARDVVNTVHAHPTVSEGIVRAAEDALGLPPSGC